MKTKTINLYSFDELSKEAQERAHRDWRNHNGYIFLEDHMAERLHELLEENQIKDMNDTSKAGTKPTQVLYSLSYCQGDGAMFEGHFEWKGYNVTIKHSGHYYHYNSKNIDIYTNDSQDSVYDDNIVNAFDDIYVSICKELARYGYSLIEEEDSLENFIEVCEANDYTFTSDGKMDN